MYVAETWYTYMLSLRKHAVNKLKQGISYTDIIQSMPYYIFQNSSQLISAIFPNSFKFHKNRTTRIYIQLFLCVKSYIYYTYWDNAANKTCYDS